MPMNKRRKRGSPQARITSVRLLPEDEQMLSALRRFDYWNTPGKLLSWAIRAKHAEVFGPRVTLPMQVLPVPPCTPSQPGQSVADTVICNQHIDESVWDEFVAEAKVVVVS